MRQHLPRQPQRILSPALLAFILMMTACGNNDNTSSQGPSSPSNNQNIVDPSPNNIDTPQPTEPTTGDPTLDSDGDGITDHDEVTIHQTNPNNTDSDGDGISDKEEIITGIDGVITNPNSADSDNDGILDTQELLIGTNPTVADLPPANVLTKQVVIAHDTSDWGNLITHLPVTNFNNSFYMSNPFGPRIKLNGGPRYDFHRGVDLSGDIGDPVYAVANAVLHAAYASDDPNTAYPNAGNVIILRIDLPQPRVFHGKQYDRLYVHYYHLATLGQKALAYIANNNVQSAVSGGEQIATLGDTGDTIAPHLHIEFRLATNCSLEFQLLNLDAACAQWGFDPHINGIDFLAPLREVSYSWEILSVTKTKIVALAKIDRRVSDLNGVVLRVYPVTNPLTPSYEKVIDFNLRTGLDASTTANLDQPQLDGFYLKPDDYDANIYNLEVTATVPNDIDWSYIGFDLSSTEGAVATLIVNKTLLPQ